jgi:hypothetical protein
MGATRRRRSGRAGRPAMRSPARPPAGRKEHRRRFWAAIARGLSSEDAAAAAGVSGAVGVRWFREGWRDAVGRPGTAVGALTVVRRARGDHCSSGAWLRRAGDRAGARAFAVDDLEGAASQCRDPWRGLEYRASTAQWHADRRSRRPKPAKRAGTRRSCRARPPGSSPCDHRARRITRPAWRRCGPPAARAARPAR